jgi:hypothetical protein
VKRVKESVDETVKKAGSSFGKEDVAASACEKLSYGSSSPNCARTSSRPLGEKSAVITVIKWLRG